MKNIFLILIIATFFISCGDDFLDVSPSSALSTNNAILSNEDLELAVNDVYRRMTGSNYYGAKYLIAGDMLGDDVYSAEYASGNGATYYDYDWTRYSTPTAQYLNIYGHIAHINQVIELSKALEENEEKKQLVAEIRALRALMHFDIAKLYGPFPLNLGKGAILESALCVPIMDGQIGLKDTEAMLRNNVTEVYSFILKELTEALTDFPSASARKDGYLSTDAVKAMLARVNLYIGNYDEAFTNAESVIQSGNYTLLPISDYVESWGKTYSSEAIFELDITKDLNPSWNSIGHFSLGDGGYREISASKHFESLMMKDTNDVRFDLFVFFKNARAAGYLPTKKYPGREKSYINNIPVFRLPEMYLIAAECKILSKTNSDPVVAAEYLNNLRENRTTTNPRKYDASITLEDVLYERRLELFGEGHRAFDLWRNNMSVVRWMNDKEKTDLLYTKDDSDGVIEFDDYKRLIPYSESQLELYPEEYREAMQNPGY